MAHFSYTARSRKGEKIQGSIEAMDRRAALLQIENMGYIPVIVREKTAEAAQKQTGARFSISLRRSRRPKMAMRDMLIFTNELSDLLSSGMKLGNALNTLSHRKAHVRTDTIIKSLRDEIIQGSSLSDALSMYKESFPALYISMVRAGEASGNLSEIMQRIVRHYERINEIKEKVIMALVYPAIILLVGFATLIFAITWVIPRFSMIFEELGSTLPLPTRIMIGLSSVMIHYGWLIAIVLIAVAILFSRYIKTEPGRLWWHGFQLKLPLVKNIVTASAFNQFAHILGLLIANGVPVLDALTIMEQAIGNVVIAREVRNAKDRVTDGTTISGPLAAGKIFPPLLTDMLAIGEETGDMAGSLSHIARRYESDLDRNLKLFTTLLEPILIVLMAILVGFIAISILLAVFDLTSGLSV